MKLKNLCLLIMLSIASVFSLNAQEWNTNIEEAKIIAAKEGKPILLTFQGSDWCAPCIKLDKKIWHSTAFKNYAEDNLVLVKADFPRRKKNQLSKEQKAHNTALAEKYNQQGIFPLVVLLDGTGKVLGQTGYKKLPPEEYVDLLKSILN